MLAANHELSVTKVKQIAPSTKDEDRLSAANADDQRTQRKIHQHR